MRAAVVHKWGVPAVGDFEVPRPSPGQAVASVLCAGVNPVDVAICAGTYYAGQPPLPFVAGREGVAMIDAERVYFDAPVAPHGSMAELCLIDPQRTLPVPDGLADGVAVALGIAGLTAWLALTWRARLQEGEHVLVLGASGVLGQIAVQAAKLLGASRVVAAARSPEALERCITLGADAAVRIGEADDLAAAFSDAAENRIDVVVDPLFGEPLLAAVNAASFGARLVHLGASAGEKATLPSPAIRGKMLVIMGFTNMATPMQTKREAYRRMADAALCGDLRVDVDALELEQVAVAWERLSAGAHKKLVLVP